MNLIQLFSIALGGGITLLLSEIVGDKFQLDDFQKNGFILGIYMLIIGSTFIIGYGGLMLLGKTIINLVIFFTLLFLPVKIYNILKK